MTYLPMDTEAARVKVQFNKAVRMRMAELDWRLGDVGEAMGISDRTVGTMLRQNDIKLSSAGRMAEALGCEIRLTLVPKEEG